MEENKKPIIDGIDKFEAYFKEDLDAIEEELTKSKSYSDIIDNEIKKITDTTSLGATKGSQHYLIEHISNAVQLQSQRQSLRKDRFNIKKAIMDYANRLNPENADDRSVLEEINKLLELDKKNKKNEQVVYQDMDDLDAAIDSALEEDSAE